MNLRFKIDLFENLKDFIPHFFHLFLGFVLYFFYCCFRFGPQSLNFIKSTAGFSNEPQNSVTLRIFIKLRLFSFIISTNHITDANCLSLQPIFKI